jgi:hypothetical protein
MAISVFPEPTGVTDKSFAVEIVELERTYVHNQVFEAGIYSISIAPTSTNATVAFVSNSAFVTSVTTSSGISNFTLSGGATKVFITGRAGGTAGAIITITKSATTLTASDIGNGTLDTINTSGTYNQTGLLSVLAFGGGSAGGRGYGPGSFNGAPGGNAGNITLGYVYTNGATTVTIGAKGTAANTSNTSPVAPTASTFGNLVSSANASHPTGGGGAGVNYGSNSQAPAGTASAKFLSFNTNSTTGGGGGGGGGNSPASVGGGSGIGTGGAGAPGGGGGQSNPNPLTRGANGTGKASGGGGGAAVGNANLNAAGRFGGDGGDGVIYVLRGF